MNPLFYVLGVGAIATWAFARGSHAAGSLSPKSTQSGINAAVVLVWVAIAIGAVSMLGR